MRRGWRRVEPGERGHQHRGRRRVEPGERGHQRRGRRRFEPGERGHQRRGWRRVEPGERGHQRRGRRRVDPGERGHQRRGRRRAGPGERGHQRRGRRRAGPGERGLPRQSGRRFVPGCSDSLNTATTCTEIETTSMTTCRRGAPRVAAKASTRVERLFFLCMKQTSERLSSVSAEHCFQISDTTVHWGVQTRRFEIENVNLNIDFLGGCLDFPPFLGVILPFPNCVEQK